MYVYVHSVSCTCLTALICVLVYDIICPPCEITDQWAHKTSIRLCFTRLILTLKQMPRKHKNTPLPDIKWNKFSGRGRPLPIPHSLVTLSWIYSRASVFPFLFIYDTNTAQNDPRVSQPCQTIEGNTKQWLQPWKWSNDLVLSWSTTNSQGTGCRILHVRTRAVVRNDAVCRMTQQPPPSSVVKSRRLSLFGHCIVLYCIVLYRDF